MPSAEPADLVFAYENTRLVKKPKLMRMSKACVACRKIKVKCLNSGGAPCQRCWEGNLSCVFEESKRGGRRPGVKNVATRVQLDETTQIARDSRPLRSAETTANEVRSRSMTRVTAPPVVIEASPAPEVTDYRLSTGHIFAPPAPPQPIVPTGDEVPAASRSETVWRMWTHDTPATSPRMQQQSELDILLAAAHELHDTNPKPLQGDPAFLRLMNPNNVRGPDASNEDYHVVNSDEGLEEQGTEPTPAKSARTARLDPISVISRAAVQSAKVRQRLDLGLSPEEAPDSPSGSLAQSATSNNGVADASYFQPSSFQTPAGRLKYITKRRPVIFEHIRADDVSQLFAFFFRDLHAHYPILDKDYHTPERVAQCSPFLMTICAVSSHFMPEYSTAQDAIGNCAMDLAFSVPSRGHRSPMSAQAHLILTHWSVIPQARLEEDRTNVLFELAKSAVFDLGLHRFRKSDLENAENSVIVRNKIRIYLFTYLRDQEFAVQLGRSASIRESAATRNPEFYCSQPLSPEDLTSCMMIELYRILARTMEHFRVDPGEIEPGQPPDYTLHTEQFEDQLKGWKGRFSQLFHTTDALRRRPETQAQFAAQTNFYYHYSLLVVASFGLSDALDHDPLQIGHFFNMCYTNATAVLRSAKQALSKIAAYRFSPDGYFVAISYAAVSLLRFCRPRLRAYHDRTDSIIELISSTADILERKASAPSQVICQYSMFLRALLEAYESEFFDTPSGAKPPLSVPVPGTTETSEPSNIELGGRKPNSFGLDQMLPSQWAALDSRFSTVHSFAASDLRDSLLLPGYNLPNIDSADEFLTPEFSVFN